jgi:glycosyltransferase involved in cell wall biosynthesis
MPFRIDNDAAWDSPSPGQCNLSISVIIPAYNEEGYLPATLSALRKASAVLATTTGQAAEIIVVDNQSTDRTVALSQGARVVPEAIHNIARVRNTGADAAGGDILVFVDADTIVPESLLVRVCQALSDPMVVGGAFDTVYRPKRIVLRVYLALWRVFGRFFRMAQGPTQFVRRQAFVAVGGYNERLYMGEDVDFYWRLKKFAEPRGENVKLVRDLRVVPSTRRFDRWPLWRTLVWTNPLWIAIFQRRASMWKGWYSNALR